MLAEISVIFLGPLALAVVGTLVYQISDAPGWSKTLALTLLTMSVVFQFATDVPFLLPLIIQIVLCIWIVLYYQLPR